VCQAGNRLCARTKQRSTHNLSHGNRPEGENLPASLRQAGMSLGGRCLGGTKTSQRLIVSTQPVSVQSRIRKKTCYDQLGRADEYWRMTCAGTVSSRSMGCGCAEYVTTRICDIDTLAVRAEARGIAWTALPEHLPVWVRLADMIRGRREAKLATTAPFHGSSMVSSSGASLWRSSSGLAARSSRTSRTGRFGLV
jgi:hypothetical protein